MVRYNWCQSGLLHLDRSESLFKEKEQRAREESNNASRCDILSAELVENILQEAVQGTKVSMVVIPFVCHHWRMLLEEWTKCRLHTSPDVLIEEAATWRGLTSIGRALARAP